MAAGITDELRAMSLAPGEALFLASSVHVLLRNVRRSLKCSVQSLFAECLMPSALKLSSFLRDIILGVHPSVCTMIVGFSSTAVSRPCCTSRVRSLVRLILMRKVSENAETMSVFSTWLLLRLRLIACRRRMLWRCSRY